jgi:hypothetical protein
VAIMGYVLASWTLRRAAALLAATAPVNSMACNVAVASGRPSR